MKKLQCLFVILAMSFSSLVMASSPHKAQDSDTRPAQNLIYDYLTSPFPYTTILSLLLSETCRSGAERLEMRGEFKHAAPHRQTQLFFLMTAILPNSIFLYRHYDAFFGRDTDDTEASR